MTRTREKRKKALWCNLISCWFGLSTDAGVQSAHEGGQFKVESIMSLGANLLLCLIHQVCQVAAMTSPFSLLLWEGRHCHDTMFFLLTPAARALKFHLLCARGGQIRARAGERQQRGRGQFFTSLQRFAKRGAFETNLMKKRRLLSSRHRLAALPPPRI